MVLMTVKGLSSSLGFWIAISWAAALRGEIRPDLIYRQVDGVGIALDAYVPDTGRLAPAVIYVHGGGFVGGDKRPYPPWLDLVAADGFAWFSVNYRLAPKYLVSSQVEDVEAAISFIQAHAAEFKIDPKRLFLMGASSGGYVVSAVGVKHQRQDGLAGVVSLFGEYDIEGRTKPTTECVRDGKVIHFDTAQDCLADRWKAFFGAPDASSPAARQIFREATPLVHVHRGIPPFLLLHGTKDFNIPYREAVHMCDAIKSAGADCELITVEGAGHGGWDASPAFSVYRQPMRAWLGRMAARQ